MLYHHLTPQKIVNPALLATYSLRGFPNAFGAGGNRFFFGAENVSGSGTYVTTGATVNPDGSYNVGTSATIPNVNTFTFANVSPNSNLTNYAAYLSSSTTGNESNPGAWAWTPDSNFYAYGYYSVSGTGRTSHIGLYNCTSGSPTLQQTINLTAGSAQLPACMVWLGSNLIVGLWDGQSGAAGLLFSIYSKDPSTNNLTLVSSGIDLGIKGYLWNAVATDGSHFFLNGAKPSSASAYAGMLCQYYLRFDSSTNTFTNITVPGINTNPVVSTVSAAASLVAATFFTYNGQNIVFFKDNTRGATWQDCFCYVNGDTITSVSTYDLFVNAAGAKIAPWFYYAYPTAGKFYIFVNLPVTNQIQVYSYNLADMFGS